MAMQWNPTSPRDGEAGFHYSSVLGTAEGAQKACQMKMGSKEMWSFAQSSSDDKVTGMKALRLSALT